MQITIDVPGLKVKHMRQLEKARSFSDFVQWFADHGGVTVAELDELSLTDLMALATDVQVQIAAGMKLPKASGSNS